MILGYYILWRLTNSGIPVDLLYVILMGVSMFVIIEVIDRIGKGIKKKKLGRK